MTAETATATTPDDDLGFHPVASADPHWTETGWWGFWVPERGLAGSIYTLFRPNLGVVATGVHVWDAHARTPWGAPYSRSTWHLPIPEGADPTSFELANGLKVDRLVPLERYRWTYADEDFGLDLDVRGVDVPHRLAGPWFGTGERGHYDQPTHVTGTIQLDGEEIPVDCWSLRDRSWHERSELGHGHNVAGYTYATISEDEAFHVLTRLDEPAPGAADDQQLYGGFLRRDGVTADLVAGRRIILDRDVDGSVKRLRLELEDAAGRTLVAEGDSHLTFPFVGSTAVFAWYGLIEWELEDGRRVWGEDQDCWAPQHLLRTAARRT